MKQPQAITDLERRFTMLLEAVEALAEGSGVEEDRWQAKRMCEAIRQDIEETQNQRKPKDV